jgi:hypothetical protein
MSEPVKGKPPDDDVVTFEAGSTTGTVGFATVVATQPV